MASVYANPMFGRGIEELASAFGPRGALMEGQLESSLANAAFANSRSALNQQEIGLRGQMAAPDATPEAMMRLAAALDFANAGKNVGGVLALDPTSTADLRSNFATATGTQAYGGTEVGHANELANALARQRVSTGGAVRTAEIAAAQRAEAEANALAEERRQFGLTAQAVGDNGSWLPEGGMLVDPSVVLGKDDAAIDARSGAPLGSPNLAATTADNETSLAGTRLEILGERLVQGLVNDGNLATTEVEQAGELARLREEQDFELLTGRDGRPDRVFAYDDDAMLAVRDTIAPDFSTLDPASQQAVMRLIMEELDASGNNPSAAAARILRRYDLVPGVAEQGWFSDTPSLAVRPKAAAGGAPDPTNALSQAQTAIAAGADPAAVRRRLQENGIDPSLLDGGAVQ